MKKILLTLTLTLGYVYSYSQCTPDPIYQDSTYNIWNDTIINLPSFSRCIISISFKY